MNSDRFKENYNIDARCVFMQIYIYTNVCVRAWVDGCVCMRVCFMYVLGEWRMSRYDIGIRLLPDINSITNTVVSAHRGVVK